MNGTNRNPAGDKDIVTVAANHKCSRRHKADDVRFVVPQDAERAWSERSRDAGQVAPNTHTVGCFRTGSPAFGGAITMGIDVIAARTPARDRDSNHFQDLTEEDLDAFRAAEIDMRQVAGPGTFWGWERWQLVRTVRPGEISDPAQSEIGLEWVPPERVREIAAAFERADAAELLLTADLRSDTGVDVVEGLRRFFRVCAERGLGLVYWY